MDLNQLYFDHQVLLIRADNASTRRTQHESLLDAGLIAARIGCRQHALGASAARSWDALTQ